MAEKINKDIQDPETSDIPAGERGMEDPAQGLPEEARTTPDSFREASYVLLFIAAVFVVNAMETGSYRTPWPVALLTSLAGLGLYGYSCYLQYRARSEK
jgi:hypothetical protein